MRTMHLIESAQTGHGGRGMHSFLSFSAHVAMVVAALYATARQPATPETAPDPRVYFVPEPRPAQPARSAPAIRTTPKAATPAPRRQKAVAHVAAPPVAIPSPDVPLADPSAPVAAEPAPSSGNVAAVPDPGHTGRSGSYAVDEVEVPAAALSKSGPDYPERAIRNAVSGSVMAQFIVGANGRVERDIVILDSTSPDFTSAVETFLRRTRYRPARVGGRPVRQMVEQRFVFTL